MVLDVIIALFGSLFALVGAAAAAVVIPFVNLILMVIEFIVGIFVSGFEISRLERKKERTRGTTFSGALVVLLLVLGVGGWAVFGSKWSEREITFVAVDGHSLPFASLVVRTSKGDQHVRTDNAGNVVVKRFGLRSITVRDPRYVEKTWKKSALKKTVVVERTKLGSSLDYLADKLFKPAKEDSAEQE